MGLSFTSIPDRSGAALYVLYDGTEIQRRKWQDVADKVTAETKAQTLVLSVRDKDGEMIRDFYDLNPMVLPYILVVRDNDEIFHSWNGQSMPQLGDITYALKQVGV